MIRIQIFIEAEDLFKGLKLLDLVQSEVEERGINPLFLNASGKDGRLNLRVTHLPPVDVVSGDIIIYENSYNELPWKNRIRGLPYIIDNGTKNQLPLRREG